MKILFKIMAIIKRAINLLFHRSYEIQKIFDLHGKKSYKIETLFMARSIFYRYLMDFGH